MTNNNGHDSIPLDSMADITRSGRKVRTTALRKLGQAELEIEVNNDDLLPQAEEFLKFVINYVRESSKKILPGETLPYGMWLLKFMEGKDSLDVWEYDRTATEFVRGGSLTLTYWRDQHNVCEQFGVPFVSPIADRLTVVDDGVVAGLTVEGVRYPSPDHMSGWWITSDKYNGRIETLRREHTYHVTAARPDLVPYLALPFGFRFTLRDGHADVWFDEGVAAEPVSST